MKRYVAFWLLPGLLAATGALPPKGTAQSVPVVVDPRIELMGPVGGEEGLPAFGSARRMAVLAWHEFSHTFVNPLTTAHRGELEKYAALYEPIAKEMARQAYPNWNIAVSEHVVRAITTRLAYLEEGEETGAKALKGEEKRGFIYIAALAERLKQYEAAREAYPTLADFYPQLIDVFREAAEKAAK